MRVVVLVSGSGSLLQALLDATADPDYPVRIVAVGADRPGITGSQRAESAGIPTFTCRLPEFSSREDWDRALAEECAAHEPDLVVSAGFMKLVGPEFLARFGGRYLNSHPALLPSFPGMHGVRDALDYGVRVTGCTLFVVDEGVDTGPILAQQAVEVLPDDDEESLHERIKAVERRTLVRTLERLAVHGWTVRGRKVSIGVTANSGRQRRAVHRALIGVSDKAGLLELATGLHAAGVEIVSTGGTARTISAAGVPVTPVEELTGFPEALDGRVKTLHPRVHAGLLADQRKQEHVEQLAELDIAAFDLLVVNLYPFNRTVASGAEPEEVVENIDIGGPAMVRAAAKNHANTTVVVDPNNYEWVVERVRAGGFDETERAELAAAAFRHTASYDVAVAGWMTGRTAPEGETFPGWAGETWERRSALRYGENPHQPAALYVSGGEAVGLAAAAQLHGKEMSYNNYVDADAAWRAAHDHRRTCVAVVKHANPCGIAVSDAGDVAEAHRKAHQCDPVSAFGGVIASNREVSVGMAEQIAEVFTEVVVAPGYAEGALEVLQRKKNVRILTAQPPQSGRVEMRAISGGLLMQGADEIDADGDDPSNWTLACGDPVDEATLRDLEFAWRTCRAVKSNAILLADDEATVGVGMGQVNRVDSARLAVSRSGERAAGSVAASDAFFPFPDGLQVLLDAGVRAVVQPGGSVRDEEVTEAARAAGVPLYLTGTRHFAH
nr:bifunctional phosphoribosylaminoimidazolecarboxamide formyltransferase/IMP cyclohydrolase [Actinopolyspora righensis]